jgi:hypothetical protein
MLWPAAIVVGKEIPLNENSELLLLADVIVTLAPTALNAPLFDAVDPTVTFPNDALEGERLSCPVAVPEPLSGIETLV